MQETVLVLMIIVLGAVRCTADCKAKLLAQQGEITARSLLSSVNAHDTLKVRRNEPRMPITKVVVDRSAADWSVCPKFLPLRPELGHPDTIIRGPNGKRTNMGQTMYPDTVRSSLWLLSVKRLSARFLLLYVSPVASGGSTMTLFRIGKDGTPIRQIDLHHHYEWSAGGEDNGRISAAEIENILFVDSDGDGRVELKENSVGRDGGTCIFFDFDGQDFVPKWIETYRKDANDALEMISRIRAGTRENAD